MTAVPQPKKNYIVATAGHVDHGKSSLVKALTGTDPDRLPEEKERHITIDLGFAELALGPDLHVGIIDVPGHEDFVGNMIAGIGAIDLALLVVAADDGWMPQTEEHLQILQYLGVDRAVVALTKTDIADGATAEVQIRERLAGTSFSTAPIMRTSFQNLTGLTGQVSGLTGLKESLAEALSPVLPQRDIEKPRLFVDRVFTLHGVGTVVTGTLTGGTLRIGQTVTVQPGGASARIRSIQSHNRSLDIAEPGARIALNLPELTPHVDVRRGEVITSSEFTTVSSFAASIHVSARPNPSPPLKSGASVYLHHGSGRVPAKVFLHHRDKLMPGESDTAHLRTCSPLLAFVGDRFVLRDASQRHTVAGGTIVGRIVAEAAALFGDEIGHCTEYEIASRGIVSRNELLSHSRFARNEIDAALVALTDQKKVVVKNNMAMRPETWRALREKAVAAVTAAHKSHPDRRGIQLGELRGALDGYSSDALDAVIAELVTTDFVQQGSLISSKSHQPTLPAQFVADAAKVVGQLSTDRRNPATQASPRAVVSFLVNQGTVIELAPGVLLRSDVFVEMKNEVVELLSRKGRATASELRQALGTSRRVIIPFLEMLDRQRVTMRIGDQRTLAGSVSAAKLHNASETRR